MPNKYPTRVIITWHKLQPAQSTTHNLPNKINKRKRTGNMKTKWDTKFIVRVTHVGKEQETKEKIEREIEIQRVKEKERYGRDRVY